MESCEERESCTRAGVVKLSGVFKLLSSCASPPVFELRRLVCLHTLAQALKALVSKICTWA